MNDMTRDGAMRKPASEYPQENVAIPRLMPRARPGEAVINRWLNTPASGRSPQWNGPLVEGLRAVALEEAASLVCAQSYSLVITDALLVSGEGVPRRRIVEDMYDRRMLDTLARSRLAGHVVACIADPTLIHEAEPPDDKWDYIMFLTLCNPDRVAQLWAENIVFLTEGVTWFSVVAVANELLTAGYLSGKEVANVVRKAAGHYALRHHPKNLKLVEGLQCIRHRMLSRGSGPFQDALDRVTRGRH